MNQNVLLSIVILAAGKGTRMKSAQAKVLHNVFFRPMLHYVLQATQTLTPHRTVVIVGHQEQAVRESLTSYNVEIVKQEEQLGTGHAVQMTQEAIPEDNGLVMILCGDTPLISTSSLENMLNRHIASGDDLTVMSTILDSPYGYGRIVSQGANITAIVEEKEADSGQRKIKEINAGIYLVKRKLLFDALESITPDNTQGEFYLTDIVQYAVSKGIAVKKYINNKPIEVLGVNSRVELEAAHSQLQTQRNIELMQQGITMQNIDTITISPFSEIGVDTLLMQGVTIMGKSVVGQTCILENGAIIDNCIIGNNVHIGAYAVLRNQTIANNSEIEPLSYRK